MTTLSESTKKAYQNAMKQLRTLTTASVTNVAEIQKYVDGSTYSDSTKTVIYCAVKGLHQEELTDAQITQYRDIIKKFIDKKKAQPPQVATETQKEKMISWEDVLKVREAVKGKVALDDFFSQFEYVLLCLYTMFPPRRLEYSNMKVIESESPLTVHTENTFVLEPPTFIFTTYKTASTYGVQRFEVPEFLAGVLKDHVETWDLEYLLTSKNGKPMSNHTLGNRIIKIFNREIQKDVGVSMLRHSYITKMREGEQPLGLQKDIASKMAHSVIKSMEYRFVDDDE